MILLADELISATQNGSGHRRERFAAQLCIVWKLECRAS